MMTLFACVAVALLACAAAQDAALAIDQIDAANATAGQAAAETPAAPMEFPVFQYEAIFPNGIFNVEAYGNWLRSVTEFYTAQAVGGIEAVEGMEMGAFGFPGFRPAASFFNPSTYFNPATCGFPSFGFGQGPLARAASALTGR